MVLFRSLLLFLLFTFLPVAWADPIVVYVNDQKPWSFKQDGEIKGLSVSFLHLLSKAIDHPIAIDAAPYHRLLKDFEAGRMDFTMFLQDQQPKDAIPVVKIIDVDIVALPRQGVEFNSLTDLSHLRVGKMRGAMYSRKLEDSVELECIEVHSYQQALQLLIKGRLDVVVGTPMAIRYAYEDIGIDKSKFAQPVILDQVEAWLYASKHSKHKHQIQPIRNTVERFTQNKILQSLASTMYQWLNN